MQHAVSMRQGGQRQVGAHVPCVFVCCVAWQSVLCAGARQLTASRGKLARKLDMVLAWRPCVRALHMSDLRVLGVYAGGLVRVCVCAVKVGKVRREYEFAICKPGKFAKLAITAKAARGTYTPRARKHGTARHEVYVHALSCDLSRNVWALVDCCVRREGAKRVRVRYMRTRKIC